MTQNTQYEVDLPIIFIPMQSFRSKLGISHMIAHFNLGKISIVFINFCKCSKRALYMKLVQFCFHRFDIANVIVYQECLTFVLIIFKECGQWEIYVRYGQKCVFVLIWRLVALRTDSGMCFIILNLSTSNFKSNYNFGLLI